MENWRKKALHGQFLRETEDLTRSGDRWTWLRDGSIKRETETLILAAQEQSLRKNAIKVKRIVYVDYTRNQMRQLDTLLVVVAD